MLKSNERSEAIELIKESQLIIERNDFIFKSATGELSLSKSDSDADKRANTLFPDVLFFNDKEELIVSVGWELKMPDVDINDIELYNNAVDKANRLNTNIFVLWNFKHTLIYTRKRNENKWNLDFSKSIGEFNRIEVSKNRKIWKKVLEEVIIRLNQIILDENIQFVPLSASIESTFMDISEKHAKVLSKYYEGISDRKFKIWIKKWHKNEMLEFHDDDKISENEIYIQYSKYIILNWLNRITFANLLKENFNVVKKALNTIIDENSSINIIGDAFVEATKKADFYTILNVEDYEKK